MPWSLRWRPALWRAKLCEVAHRLAHCTALHSTQDIHLAYFGLGILVILLPFKWCTMMHSYMKLQYLLRRRHISWLYAPGQVHCHGDWWTEPSVVRLCISGRCDHQEAKIDQSACLSWDMFGCSTKPRVFRQEMRHGAVSMEKCAPDPGWTTGWTLSSSLKRWCISIWPWHQQMPTSCKFGRFGVLWKKGMLWLGTSEARHHIDHLDMISIFQSYHGRSFCRLNFPPELFSRLGCNSADVVGVA